MQRLDNNKFVQQKRPNTRHLVWHYRYNIEPLVKKTIKFPIPYAREEVLRYLKQEVGLTNITVWSNAEKEPPVIKEPGIGVCPICKRPGKCRERRPNGNDTCENGHVYPSKDALIV